MNCEDFRERLLRRPDEIDEAMGEHMAVCRGCAGMAEQIGAMDGVLREALAVEVPDNLGQTAALQKMLGAAGVDYFCVHVSDAPVTGAVIAALSL